MKALPMVTALCTLILFLSFPVQSAAQSEVRQPSNTKSSSRKPLPKKRCKKVWNGSRYVLKCYRVVPKKKTKRVQTPQKAVAGQKGKEAPLKTARPKPVPDKIFGLKGRYFVGVDYGLSQRDRDYNLQTLASGYTLQFEETGETFSGDGLTHTFSTSESYGTIGLSAGIETDANNRYSLGLYNDEDLFELVFKGRFAFPQWEMMQVVPYADLQGSLTYKEAGNLASLAPDGYGYGVGVGGSYLLNPKWELSVGLLMSWRNWFGVSDTYITEETWEETENRFYFNVNYRFDPETTLPSFGSLF